MQATISNAPVTASQRWTSRILIGLPALFLLADGVGKLIKPAPVVEATVNLGYVESVILPLGLILSICTIVYLVPRTAILGAILLTGYLGGAVATHVRAGSGAFPIVFPVLIGAMLWGGLQVPDARLRALLPLASPPVPSPKKQLWAGRIVSALPVLMLIASGIIKLTGPAQVVQEFARFGYQQNVLFSIGILELVCTLLYLIPQTSVLGAILLTGYLGGAIATHVRIGDPFLPPIFVGILLWLGLYLRDMRIRQQIPLRA